MLKITKGITAAGMAATLLITSSVPVLASSTVTLDKNNTSRDIAVTCEVGSSYTISLPASIRFEEANTVLDEQGEIVYDDEGYPVYDHDNDLKFRAHYRVGVRGNLLNQKVTLSPVNRLDDGKYSMTMRQIDSIAAGVPQYTAGGESLLVGIDQRAYEWIPAGRTPQNIHQLNASFEFEDESMAEGELLTNKVSRAGDTYYGELTFTVSCNAIN